MYKHIVKDKRHSLFNHTIHLDTANHSYYNMDSIGDLSDEGTHRFKNLDSNLSKPRLN